MDNGSAIFVRLDERDIVEIATALKVAPVTLKKFEWNKSYHKKT